MNASAPYLLTLTVALLLALPAAAPAAEQCLTCHEGIEKISEVDGMDHLTCTDCHKGDAAATTAEAAHKGMWANPSDLRVVKETCGACHPDEVQRVTTSLHATSAGKISGTRYAWGAQARGAVYANVAVEAPKAEAKHALKSLKQLPFYDPASPEGPDNTPADDYLREQCLRCHVWSGGHERDGDYRASGCAACHVLYSDAGTYEGGDMAIPKDQKGRPRFHRLTTKIPETQCLHCHNRGGRTGVSFIGTIESDGYGSPYTPTGGKQPKLHGKNYNHLQANVHYERGLSCIDCHTRQDIHGDGNLYAKKWQAVEIECEDCHGTGKTRSKLKTSWGNPFPNLKEEGGKVVLTSKVTGKEHVVPQVAELELTGEAFAAHVGVPAHLEKLECYTCHDRWAPQCYGCHAKQDIGKKSGDWVNGAADDPSAAGRRGNRLKTAHSWDENRSYVRWETPVLGWNSEGRVSPYVPGCQVIFTQVDGEKPLVSNKIFTTVDGTSGLSTNPVYPHTTTRESRTCADCHASTKAQGLGSGYYVTAKNGVDVPFELERIVDEQGRQLQATNHEGARPFNQAELEKIARAGTCVACHGGDADFWAAAKKAAGQSAPTDELHQKAIRTLVDAARR